MKRSVLLVVAVAVMVLLAGCGGLDPGDFGDAPEDSTDDATATEATPAEATDAPTATETETATPTETETATPTETPTPTPGEEWSEPEQPNRPLQDNRDEEEGSRIHSVEVTGFGGGEEGNASFRLDVTANTSMPSVDPAEHGSVRGEPFFLVYLNASTESDDRFTYVEGTLVERSPELRHDSEGEYTLMVPEGAFEENGADPGEHELLVLLMDRDKEWDDIYGLERVTVQYEPGEE